MRATETLALRELFRPLDETVAADRIFVRFGSTAVTVDGRLAVILPGQQRGGDGPRDVFHAPSNSFGVALNGQSDRRDGVPSVEHDGGSNAAQNFLEPLIAAIRASNPRQHIGKPGHTEGHGDLRDFVVLETFPHDDSPDDDGGA